MSGAAYLTAQQVVDAITKQTEAHPESALWPVHILDMGDDGEEQTVMDGLVTTVEVDCMDEKQGPVISLTSWPNERAWRDAHGLK